jgi:hypothetical protein
MGDPEDTKDLVPKKKSGRRPGSKSTYKLTPELIHQAKMMYISGKTIPEIQNLMGLSSSNTLYAHMKKEKWEEKREKFLSSSMSGKLNTMMKNTLAETEKMIEDLRTIRDRAIEPIDAGSLKPGKFGEAGTAYMNAVELEKKLRTEALHLSFITEVAKILREEIKDTDLLIKIGKRLRDLFDDRKKELEGP